MVVGFRFSRIRLQETCDVIGVFGLLFPDAAGVISHLSKLFQGVQNQPTSDTIVIKSKFHYKRRNFV